MAQTQTLNRRGGLGWRLTPPVKLFLGRRAREAVGLVFCLAALALALSILSHDAGDPSLNHATDAGPGNLLGAGGAVIADLAVQLLAWAALLPVLALAFWGEYLIRHRAIGWVAGRIAALPLSLAGLVLALGLVGMGLAPSGDPVDGLAGVGPGGALGELLAGRVAGLLAAAHVPAWAAALGIGALSLLVAGFSLPLGWGQWLTAFARTVRVGWRSAILAARAGGAVAGFVLNGLGGRARHEDDEFDAPDPRDRLRRHGRRGRREPGFAGVPNESDDEDDFEGPAHPVLDTRRVAGKQPRLKAGRREKEGRQKKLDLPVPADATGAYQLPPLDILAAPTGGPEPEELDQEALEQNARLLEAVLADFGVKGDIVQVRPGPVVTMYELEPAPGTKTSRVISLADDIARSMSAVSVRIAVVPGRNAIGIELPNAVREMVALRELLASANFEKSKGLALALGKNIAGEPVFADLARMPHLLIAGTTGSGKSVGVNAMIVSLLYRFTPDECRFIMVDPKMLELSIYDGIPHLLAPVVTDPKKAVVALKWVVREMEDRYQLMSKLGVRSIDGYNQALAAARKSGEVLTRRVQTGFDRETGKPVYEEQSLDMNCLPRIVVIVDEMADLMLVAGKDVEAAIQRLAQMARAAGIHLIMATQRPSVDVVTGTIKANFPTRIGFQVTSKIDSRTILGEQGAEQLLGQGDMLYMAGGGRITRVHGGFVSDSEVTDLVEFLCAQAAPEYDDEITEDGDVAAGIPGFDTGSAGDEAGSGNELYDQAVALVAREGKASTSFIQRHLQIGYNRAARIIEQMEKEGVVGQANHVGKREVLVSDQSEPGY